MKFDLTYLTTFRHSDFLPKQHAYRQMIPNLRVE